MKKIAFSVLVSLFAFGAYATEKPEEKKSKDNSEYVRRQYCSVTITYPNGFSETFTAGAGWLLSDNEAAMDRACEKARKAAGIDE